MKIISHSKVVEIVEFRLTFYKDLNFGGGYSFECDSAGTVDVGKLNPCALDSYKQCLLDFRDQSLPRPFIEDHSRCYTERAIGQCNHCTGSKGEVYLAGFTNTCDHCGTDYNMSGQELAPREQWGEETGESYSDIVMGGEADY